MAGFFQKALPWLTGGIFSKAGKKFLFGSPEKHKRIPTLMEGQMPLYEQLLQAGMQPGAGGAFGDAADYYRSLLSDDPETMRMLEAPEMRRFNEQIIPGLAEQYAGMGSGALSSSGFRNAAVNAGTDLSERLGAIRANLRAQGAAGLAGIGQAGLHNFSQDVITQPGTPGLLSQAAPAAANAAISYYSGMPGNWINSGNSVGQNTSPYGR